jgi:hypothetical protein
MSTRPSRRKVLIAAGVVLALVAVVVIAIVADSEESAFDDPGGGNTGEVTPPGEPPQRLGSTVFLRTSRTRIGVRPLGFRPLGSSSARGGPVGVDLEIRNVGREPYRDQPSQAATVQLEGGGEADRVYSAIDNCAGPAADSVVIAPGQTRRLCLAFAARPGNLESFVYAPEVGLPVERGAPQAAAWKFG